MNTSLKCWIYKSSKKQEMYLYLPKKDHFDDIPKALRELFGPPLFVMELILTTQRRLAKEDSQTVIKNLQQKGFHLQVPSDLKPNLYHGNED